MEYGENPKPVWTRIRYKYVVDPPRPESSNVVFVAAGWLICEYPLVVVRRSTLNSTMPVAEVLHDKWTCEAEAAVPCKVGAGGNGGASVVTVTSLEYAEIPDVVSTRILYRYAVDAARPESSNDVPVALG